MTLARVKLLFHALSASTRALRASIASRRRRRSSVGFIEDHCSVGARHAVPLQIPVLHYLIPAGVAEFPKEHSERRAFLASDFIFWDTADMEGMDTANMEDGMDAGVLQWWERDEEFEKRFRAAHSWHPRDLLRRVFGKQSAPNFNDYQ